MVFYFKMLLKRVFVFNWLGQSCGENNRHRRKTPKQALKMEAFTEEPIVVLRRALRRNQYTSSFPFKMNYDVKQDLD